MKYHNPQPSIKVSKLIHLLIIFIVHIRMKIKHMDQILLVWNLSNEICQMIMIMKSKE